MTSAVSLAQSASAGNTLNFKNRLINGDFEIWQRGTAQAFITAGVYLADRWTCMGFQQARHQRVSVTSPVTGMTARFAMRVSSSPNSDNGSGGTRMDLSQKIENLNSYDLAGQTVTYSYWIRFSSATVTSVANSTNSAFGPFNSYIQSSTANTDAATSTDSIGSVNGQSVIANGSLPTTWTKITQTATITASANNVALRLQFQLLGSTTNPGDVWYEVTELQLELGSAATAMDHRPYPIELLLCQRYCVVIGGSAGPQNYSDGYYRFTQVAVGESGGSATSIFQYPVLMRVTPSFSATGSFQLYDGSFYTVTSVTYASFGPFNACITYQAPGLTNGRAYHPLSANNQTARQVFSAEL
jgi:hypothetical protein